MQLLRNAESNADYKGLDTDKLVIDHIQVNKAGCQNEGLWLHQSYLSSSSHVEVILTEKEDIVAKPSAAEEEAPKKSTLRCGINIPR